ncbi:MAG: nicotinamide-nucleotide amidohydrolase family protein [Actinomycetia bacterium]|nr:nicotinamide-nucleotide amidohydrolase family protein [Actinomycetes bacterium]
MSEGSALAAELIERCREQGLTLASAESLTGGGVCAALTEVPGASAVVRGAVVAYATDRKHTVLGVDAQLLADRGPVDGEVALAMAQGARTVLAADLAVATTGVAGPDPQDGVAVGTVFIACVGTVQGAPVQGVEQLALAGSRQDIRSATVAHALTLCLQAVRGGGA